MSDIKPNDSAQAEDEKDWAAAKAFFETLKTNKPRPPKPQYAVTVAVSSRTLFNMVAERKIYEEDGLEKYVAYQVEHENEPLMPGASFPFVKGVVPEEPVASPINARLVSDNTLQESELNLSLIHN